MSADWQTHYHARTMSARDALGAIRSGSRVFMAAGCGLPQHLIDELVTLADKIADIELIHMMNVGLAPYTSQEYQTRFRHNALYISSDVVTAVNEGRADFTPISKLQIARLFREKRISLDAALIQVTPPDDRGYVSMGITVGISKTAAEAARYVVAEVNPNMPRTCGDSLLHTSKIHAFVHSTHPLLEAPPLEVDPVSDEIARHCSRIIEDGATLHVGYTPLAFALPKHLRDHHDLGIHTDVLSAPLVELIRTGVVTNARKTINCGKTITSLCYGTREIYDYLANNHLIEFYPAEYVNDPFFIAQHDGMVALSEARKVDLTGLVCARFRGPRFGSGFMAGASYALHGLSIVTLPATRSGGTESNIVMELDQDQGIAASTNRDEVEYVITEFGIADLRGKSIRERTLALIHIAHPKFRAELMKAAKEHRYVYADQILPEHAIYPDQFESSITLMDGSRILIRPARPTDERVVQSFLYGMDEASIRYRFHGKLETMHHSRVQVFVNLDYDGTFTLLGLRLGEAGEEEVVGIGQYLFYPEGNRAEVAFTTSKEYRNLGVATYLLRELIHLSRAKGIKTMFAEVIRENLPMLRVFEKSGVPVETHFEDGLHHVMLDLNAVSKPANDASASSAR